MKFAPSGTKTDNKMLSPLERALNLGRGSDSGGPVPTGPGIGTPRESVGFGFGPKRKRPFAQALGDTPPRDGPFAQAAAPVAIRFPTKTRAQPYRDAKGRKPKAGVNPFA